eukprot:gene3256-6443_t
MIAGMGVNWRAQNNDAINFGSSHMVFELELLHFVSIFGKIMLRISSVARYIAKRPCNVKSMATLATTEEFPLSAALSPKSPSKAIITESTLSSGIKLVSRDASNGNISIKIVVKGGSRAESLSEKGAAHFLSVTAFSGHGKRSGIRMMRDLENLGAQVSSTSDREKITYDFTVLNDKVGEAFTAVAEAVTLPLNANYLMDERKETAQLAYDAKSTSPQIILSELLHESIFGEASPLGSSLYASNIDNVSYESLLQYRSKQFLAGNVTVIGSGIAHSALQSLVEGNICLPSGSTPVAVSPYTGGEMRHRSDLGGVTHAALAFPVSGNNAVKVASVISAVLKSRLSSSSTKGYNLTAFNTSYSTATVAGVYTMSNPQSVGANLQLAADELRAIASGAAKSQIELAKSQLTLAATLALENGSAATALAAAVSIGQSTASSTDYKSVDTSAVETAAKEMLAAIPSYAVYGNTAGVSSYNTVTALCRATGVVPGL